MKRFSFRKLLALVLIFVTVFNTIPIFAETIVQGTTVYLGRTKLTINGVPSPSQTLLYNDKLYIPLGEAAQQLGFTSVWNASTNTTSITTGSGTIVLNANAPSYSETIVKNATVYLDRTKLIINGKSSPSQTLIFNDKLYIPLSEAAQQLGFTAVWNQATNTTNITKNGDSNPTAPTVSAAKPIPFSNAEWYYAYGDKSVLNLDSFTSLGEVYDDAIVFGSDSGVRGSITNSYILGYGYTTVTAALGHVDNTGNLPSTATLNVYLDRKLYTSYKLTSDMLTKNITLDVTGCYELTFVLVSTTSALRHLSSWYGLGNVMITPVSEPVNNTLVGTGVSLIDELEPFSESYYGDYRNVKADRHKLVASKEYFYFTSNSSPYVKFNLKEQYTKLHFVVEPLIYDFTGDFTGEVRDNNAYLEVYLDGKLYKKYNISTKTYMMPIDIDVTNVTVLEIRGGGSVANYVFGWAKLE